MLPGNLNAHKYPQNLWAREIIRRLQKLNVSDDAAFVDAPCGNGIIAYFVKKAFPERKVWAFDLDENLLKSPYLQEGSLFPISKKADVFQEKVGGSDNVWLLVNSLYCLPDKERLLELNKSQFRHIICIVPDKDASNFKYFTHRNPEFGNPSLMGINETIEFFKEQDYRLLENKGMTRLPFHKFNAIPFFSRIPINVKNYFFTMLDRLYFFGKNQYSILTFERYEKGNIVVRL